jgi:hypothetical protein
MNHATGAATYILTPTTLRVEAGHLLRCSPDLAGLGPPTTRLRPEYRLARSACDDFERGARCDEAAARDVADFFQPDAKFTRLLTCGDSGFNRGSDLIGRAVADGSFTG